MDINREQRDEIMRQIGEGMTSGRIDSEDGTKCSWELKADVFANWPCSHFQCRNVAVEGTDACYAHTFCDCPKVNDKYHAHYKPECPRCPVLSGDPIHESDIVRNEDGDEVEQSGPIHGECAICDAPLGSNKKCTSGC